MESEDENKDKNSKDAAAAKYKNWQDKTKKEFEDALTKANDDFDAEADKYNKWLKKDYNGWKDKEIAGFEKRWKEADEKYSITKDF